MWRTVTSPHVDAAGLDAVDLHLDRNVGDRRVHVQHLLSRPADLRAAVHHRVVASPAHRPNHATSFGAAPARWGESPIEPVRRPNAWSARCGRRRRGDTMTAWTRVTRCEAGWDGEVQQLMLHGRDREAAEFAARHLRDDQADPAPTDTRRHHHGTARTARRARTTARAASRRGSRPTTSTRPRRARTSPFAACWAT